MRHQGFGIIEIIVAVSIFSMISVTGLVTVIGSFSTNRLGSEHSQATLIAQQGLEAARSIRNQGWTSPFLATPSCLTGCGATESGGLWAWSPAQNFINGYTRTIVLSPVQRNGSGDIVMTGGTDDPDTKRITSSVTWDFSPSRSNTVSLYDYFTNYTKSIMGNWASPALQGAFDITIANGGNAVANGSSIAHSGNYVYLGRVSSGGREIFAFDISNLSAPTLCATCQRELGGDALDLAINGNFLYIASGNNSQELQIIDITSPTTLSTSPFSFFNLIVSNSGSNNADAVGVTISGSNLYMIRNGGSELLRFDVTSPLIPTLTGTGSGIVGVPTDIVVVGNYIYVTTTDNTAELQVFDINTLALVSQLDLNEGNTQADGLSLYYAGNNTLLMGRASSTAPELYSINISSPLSPAVLSTSEIGNDVVSISYENGKIFAATTNTNTDLMIINAPSLAALPALPAFGTLNTANSPIRLIYVSSLDRVFLAGSSDTTELEIIRPQ